MIFAITGPAGCGKDTAAHYVADKCNIVSLAGGDILREMLSSLGLEPKKGALGPFGTFLREQYGSDIIVKEVLRRADGKDFVANGFRSPAEAAFFKAQGAKIIFIDAPSNIRYDRITQRGRQGDTTDSELQKALDAQEHGAKTPEGENLDAVRAMADVIIQNNGTLKELHEKLDQICSEATQK